MQIFIPNRRFFSNMKTTAVRIRTLSCGLLYTMLLFCMHCQMSDPSDTFNTWSFSGYVLNGYSGNPINGATVSYINSGTEEKSVTTGKNGNFLIDKIPYGERTFRVSYNSPDTNNVRFTEKTVHVSCWATTGTNADGVAGDIARVMRLFPLSGALNGTFLVKRHESGQPVPADSILVRITYTDTALNESAPNTFQTTTDTLGRLSIGKLPLASGLTITTPDYTLDGISYAISTKPTVTLFPDNAVSLGNIYLTAADSTDVMLNAVVSNVISKDGFGLTNVPVNIALSYVLPVLPDSTDIQATITGGGNPKTVVRIHRDTVFITPVKNLGYDSAITVTISGKTQTGNRINLVFDGVKKFTTEKGIFPIASNTWDASGAPASNFGPYDTMWVKFSQPLDTTIEKIKWYETSADFDIYGSGIQSNANLWIRNDTLFVKPDLRLAIDYGKTIGFKIIITAQSGRQSDSLNFSAKLIDNIYYVKETNTKDQLGNPRSDFGVADSIIIVSNVPIREVTSISSVTDALPPADMTLDNIRVSGDTIIYKPSINLALNTTYGMDFNVTFANGIRRTDVLPVTWKTRTGVMILSTNNRQNGNFRAFNVIGDSLVITFSKEIDTSRNASVPFKVNMQTVKGVSVRTSVQWDSKLTRAAIFAVDTLPTADFGASPAYTSNATTTRAVDSVTFDLTTRDGEQVFRLGLSSEWIEMHTEKGLCVTNINLLPDHDPLLEVSSTAEPTDTFPVDGTIQITFNRNIDTTLMKAFDLSTFCSIEKGANSLKVPSTIQFGLQGRQIILTPALPLDVGAEYYVVINTVPGLGIAGADAINKHGGSFTGKNTGKRLFTKPFKTRSPDIQALTAEILPDSNAIMAVLDNRIGVSAGMVYSYIVGSTNVTTPSSLKFRINESAWNSRHADSVTGYQVQVQNVDRKNRAGGWYDLSSTIATTPYPTSNQERLHIRKAEIDLTAATFYSGLQIADGDGTGSFYQNGANLFNDSNSIQLRIRPFIGEADPLRHEVGLWSQPLSLTDNAAPCDSDFVTGSNCNNLAKGGVQIIENVSFNNGSGSTVADTGYIEIIFPEDMDVNGPAPSVTFYYGPMGGTNPPAPLAAVPESSGKNHWISARRYQIYIAVPVFDYTWGLSELGSYYNVSVAGCKDVSGNEIAVYGTPGSIAQSDHTAASRSSRLSAAAELKQGSSCVVSGFFRCD